MSSTPIQKEIFTRLHTLFSDTNRALAKAETDLLNLKAEHARLHGTFSEQNETLKRYEETFGILPPVAYAAEAPAAPSHSTAAWAPAFPPAVQPGLSAPSAPFAVDSLNTPNEADFKNLAEDLRKTFGHKNGNWIFNRLRYPS